MSSRLESGRNFLVEVTPKEMRCVGGTCPAIFRTAGGSYVIVAKRLEGDDVSPRLRKRIGAGEVAFEVPADLLDALRHDT